MAQVQDKTNWKQDFYEEVETIELTDPLSHVLGAQDETDHFVFAFTDVIKLSGHSCPAVSGAFKVTAKALKALYGDETPVRGGVRVLVKGGPTDLAYGPQAQVISFLTGASGDTGFKGLGGRWSRKDRLFFDSKDTQFNTYIFQREDTGKTVKVVYNPQAISGDPRMNELAPLVFSGRASQEQKDLFHQLWQSNVRKILIEDDQHPGLFTVEELEGFEFPDPATLTTAH